jgi:putative hydrolase of the HAD superfamily
MSSRRAVISDFGGVLTTPLLGSFAAFQNETGIPPEALGSAMQRIADADGEHPLYELERGRVTEVGFLERLGSELTTDLGHEPMRGLRARGLRMALLTNNVREWEPLWRSMMPVDEVFELVVDSAFVGMRKPEPGIYELTLERMRALDGAGDLAASDCLFVDDIEVNIDAARALGMTAVHFQTNDQAIDEIEAALLT